MEVCSLARQIPIVSWLPPVVHARLARLLLLIPNRILMVGWGILCILSNRVAKIVLLLHDQEASPSPASWPREREREPVRASYPPSHMVQSSIMAERERG